MSDVRATLRRCQPETGVALSFALMEALVGEGPSEDDRDRRGLRQQASDKMAIASECLASNKFEEGFFHIAQAFGMYERPLAVEALFEATLLLADFEFPEEEVARAKNALERSLVESTAAVSTQLVLRTLAYAAGVVPAPERRSTMWYRAIERDATSPKEIAQLREFGWEPEPHEAQFLLRRELERQGKETAYRGTAKPEEAAVYQSALLFLDQVASRDGSTRPSPRSGL